MLNYSLAKIQLICMYNLETYFLWLCKLYFAIVGGALHIRDYYSVSTTYCLQCTLAVGDRGKPGRLLTTTICASVY